MLDSIYRMKSRLFESHFCRKKTLYFFHGTQRYYERHNVSRKSVNH